MEQKQSRNGMSRFMLNSYFSEEGKSAAVTAQSKEEGSHLKVINSYKVRSWRSHGERKVWECFLLGAAARGLLETGTIHQQLAYRVEKQGIFFTCNLFQTKGTLGFGFFITKCDICDSKNNLQMIRKCPRTRTLCPIPKKDWNLW